MHWTGVWAVRENTLVIVAVREADIVESASSVEVTPAHTDESLVVSV